MNYKKTSFRVIRILIGVSLLVYLFTNVKIKSWLPFYTFQTNLMVGIWFVLAGLFPGKDQPTFWIHDGFKGALTTYITITGLVYNTILIPYEKAYVGYIPFSSIVTHMIIPLVMIIDYLTTPVVAKPQWKYLPLWLTYPLLYAAATLVNGARTGFYPYPFINPAQIGSTLQLAINYLLLIALHAGLSALYLAIARRKSK